MPYVHRENNEIVKLTNRPSGSTERLPEDDPEVIAFRNPPPPTNDEIYDRTLQNEKLLKAVVLALNDGTFVPGSSVTNAALKTAIKAKM